MKTAVYCSTRNLYKDMLPSLKSLLINSDVERVYFLIEDDEFPYELPDCVTTINVSSQKFFRPGGPNYSKPWTWMALMRAALPQILKEDLVLSLDFDLIIDKDINELWEIDMADYYLAGVEEPKKEGFRHPYVNFGVILMNLKKLREDKIDERAIHSLDTVYTFANEQDVMNNLCFGKVRLLPSTYNSSDYSAPCADPKITHYAGIGETFPWSGKRWQEKPLVEKYRNIPWEEIRCRST